jgi:hypothetical protein
MEEWRPGWWSTVVIGDRMRSPGSRDSVAPAVSGLIVNSSGAGTVSYPGDASVDKPISGIGRLIKR